MTVSLIILSQGPLRWIYCLIYPQLILQYIVVLQAWSSNHWNALRWETVYTDVGVCRGTDFVNFVNGAKHSFAKYIKNLLPVPSIELVDIVGWLSSAPGYSEVCRVLFVYVVTDVQEKGVVWFHSVHTIAYCRSLGRAGGAFLCSIVLATLVLCHLGHNQ